MRAGTIWDRATDFSAFIEVIYVIGNDKVRIKWMAALSTHAMFVVHGVRVIGRHVQDQLQGISSKLQGKAEATEILQGMPCIGMGDRNILGVPFDFAAKRGSTPNEQTELERPAKP